MLTSAQTTAIEALLWNIWTPMVDQQDRYLAATKKRVLDTGGAGCPSMSYLQLIDFRTPGTDETTAKVRDRYDFVDGYRVEHTARFLGMDEFNLPADLGCWLSVDTREDPGGHFGFILRLEEVDAEGVRWGIQRGYGSCEAKALTNLEWHEIGGGV